jgi:hypothetical protein
MIFGTMKVARSSPLRIGRLHPQEFSWYSFLEAESTPGHMVPSVASENFPSDTTGIDTATLRLCMLSWSVFCWMHGVDSFRDEDKATTVP